MAKKNTATRMTSITLVCGLMLSPALTLAWEELGKSSTDLTGVVAPESRGEGSKRIVIRNGEERIYTTTAAGAKANKYESDRGCIWEEPVSANNLPRLAPSLSWENCSGESGHAKVKTKGELFPIKKGNKIVYTIKGTSTAGSWTGNWDDRRVCKVKDQVRVKTVSGEYDTWKIVCKGKNDKRTRYYAPDPGVIVVDVRKHHKDKKRNATAEFVRWD